MRHSPLPQPAILNTLVGRFKTDARGNIAIITGMTMLAMSSLVGVGIDFTMAGRREAQLNAIADAAALSTTTPPSMALTSSQAQLVATKMFNAQAALVGGITITPLGVGNVTVTDTTGSNGVVTRNTTINYTAQSTNAFAALLKIPVMNLGGTSKVSSSTAPNIDFYILLDTSPSMGIPSSQSGIDAMVQATQQQGGCAFACHETNPTAGDVKGNPNGEDNYTLARNLNPAVTLRIDLVKQATANLYSTAQTTESQNKAQYRVATYTFDASFNTITNLTSNLSSAQNDAINKIQMLEVYNEGNLTSSQNNNDEDSQFDSAMSNTQYIPAPGKGTNASGDTPQEILFIVTDGVVDEPYSSGPTNMTYSGRTITYAGYQTDYCTPLKARGVRIAVLYTPYLPLPTNSFYNQYVSPFQPQVPTALQSCASPGLFFQVNTGGDISAAMTALFNKAIGSAHITQ